MFHTEVGAEVAGGAQRVFALAPRLAAALGVGRVATLERGGLRKGI